MRKICVFCHCFLFFLTIAAEEPSIPEYDLAVGNETLALIRLKVKNETGDAGPDDEEPTIIRLRIKNETNLAEKLRESSDDTIVRIKILNETNGDDVEDEDSNGWSVWGPWSTCTKKCGGGQQFQIRTCTLLECKGSTSRMQICNTQPCLERLSSCNRQCSGDTDCGQNYKCCTSDGCNSVCVAGSVCRFDTQSPCGQVTCRKGFECIGWTPSNCGLKSCATIPKCVCPVVCASGQYRVDQLTGLQLCECSNPTVYPQNSDIPNSVHGPPTAPFNQAPSPALQIPYQVVRPEPSIVPAYVQVPVAPASLNSLAGSNPQPAYAPLPLWNMLQPNQQHSNASLSRSPGNSHPAHPYDPVAMLKYRKEHEVDYNDYGEVHNAIG